MDVDHLLLAAGLLRARREAAYAASYAAGVEWWHSVEADYPGDLVDAEPVIRRMARDLGFDEDLAVEVAEAWLEARDDDHPETSGRCES
jgi:hypothetical protein